MNEKSSIDKSSYVASIGPLDILTPDVTSNVKTITDLWSLARMTKDVEGDPVWEVLYQMGCNPKPVENIGYNFDYGDYNGIYIPIKKDGGVMRFAFPKLANVSINSRDMIMESVNMANSLVMESKFTVMGEDVWLIYERNMSDDEDYFSIVEHILKNLKSGAELFLKIS